MSIVVMADISADTYFRWLVQSSGNEVGGERASTVVC